MTKRLTPKQSGRPASAQRRPVMRAWSPPGSTTDAWWPNPGRWPGCGTQYAGASFGRTFAGWWTSNGDADADLHPNLTTLRDRSRDLYRNAPAARGAVKTLRTNVIGSGLYVEPAIDRVYLGLSKLQAKLWEDAAEREFRLWAEARDCDYARELNLYGLQKLAYLSQRTGGDVFALLPWSPLPGVPYDLRVQLIEADRVTNPNMAADTDQISGGIERDPQGRPLAVHIQTPHPGARVISTEPTVWQRVEFFGQQTGRRNVLQLKDVDRVAQSRGEPLLSPVIETLKQFARYSEAELMAAVVNGMMSVFVKRPINDLTAPGYSGDPSGDEPWMQVDNQRLGTGTWIEGAPGEELDVIQAARPSSQFDPFFQAIMKQIGMALGIPFEVLIKHFSSSYSASRAAMLDAWKFFIVDRDQIVEDFCAPVYREFLVEAIIKGRLNAPGFLSDPAVQAAYSGAYWIGPAQGQIDEIKEVQAANLRCLYGFSTRSIECSKLSGLDYDDVVIARAEEQDLEIAAGWSPGVPTTFYPLATDEGGEEGQSEGDVGGDATEKARSTAL